MTHSALHWHVKKLKKGKEDRVLRVIKEQPLAVRKVVEQHCSYRSCNDNKHYPKSSHFRHILSAEACSTLARTLCVLVSNVSCCSSIAKMPSLIVGIKKKRF